MLTCPNCKKEFEDGVSTCDVCGAALVAAEEQTEAKAPATGINGLIEKFKTIPKKWLIYGAAGVAGLIVIIILASLLFGPAKPNFDLEEAADNLEDADYYVSYTDDEDELKLLRPLCLALLYFSSCKKLVFLAAALLFFTSS